MKVDVTHFFILWFFGSLVFFFFQNPLPFALHNANQALSAWLRSLPEGEQLMGMVQAEADIKGNATDFFRFYSDRETSQFLHLISKARFPCSYMRAHVCACVCLGASHAVSIAANLEHIVVGRAPNSHTYSLTHTLFLSFSLSLSLSLSLSR